MANQHEHSTWVSHPVCSASDSSSVQQSTNPKCLQEQMSITNVRVFQPPLLRLFFSSIYLHSLLSFCFLSLFCSQSNLRSNVHPNQSTCIQLEPDSKWLLLPQLQLCILLVLLLHHQEGLSQTSTIVFHFIFSVLSSILSPD